MKARRIVVKTNPLAVGVQGAAELLDVAPVYVRLLVSRGQLRASRTGRKLLIRYSDLNAFLDDRRIIR